MPQADSTTTQVKKRLFDCISSHVKNTDRIDVQVDVQDGRLEIIVPLVSRIKITSLLRKMVNLLKQRQGGQEKGKGDVAVSFVREQYIVLRDRCGSTRDYRTECMLPVAKQGHAIVTVRDMNLDETQLQLCVELYKMGHVNKGSGKKDDDGNVDVSSAKTPEEIREALLALGVEVFLPKAPDQDEAQQLWAAVAGYEEVKQCVKQSVTLPLMHRDLFRKMEQLTNGDAPGSARLTAGCLFTGPPGVGKTTLARIAAHAAGKPLVYVPVEGVMSKWYGEAEQRLRSVFDLTRKLKRAVLFLDELDAFAGSRDGGMHEATRRILSVLLRNLDGFECADKKSKDGDETDEDDEEGEDETEPFLVAVGATNRPTDLDAALVSRFDQSVAFPLPDEGERVAIFARYAQHLDQEQLGSLAAASPGFSGRDIVESCKQAERLWLFELLSGNSQAPTAADLTPPPVATYLKAAETRLVQCKQQQQCGKGS